jgi:hypothetical protein
MCLDILSRLSYQLNGEKQKARCDKGFVSLKAFLFYLWKFFGDACGKIDEMEKERKSKLPSSFAFFPSPTAFSRIERVPCDVFSFDISQIVAESSIHTRRHNMFRC